MHLAALTTKDIAAGSAPGRLAVWPEGEDDPLCKWLAFTSRIEFFPIKYSGGLILVRIAVTAPIFVIFAN